MLLLDSSIWDVYLAFDLLLERMDPKLFPNNWLQKYDPSEIRSWHQTITSKIEELQFNVGYTHCLIPIQNPESGMEKMMIIPLSNRFIESNHTENEKKLQDAQRFLSMQRLFDELNHINQLSSQKEILTSFSLLQLTNFIQLHIGVTHLIQDFSRHHRELGRDFFKSQYALDLLHSMIPKLTARQAQRFYYWGILKFQVSVDAEYWLYPETFRSYLNKFQD